MNTKRGIFPLLLAAALILIPNPVSAHHSTAEYDMTTVTSVKGTVTKYIWSNPHGLIYMQVKDDKEKAGEWIGELGSLNMLIRAKWSENTVKPGEQITMYGNRAKNGQQTMHVDRIVLPNGQELDAPQPRNPN